jgi:hypothetical protein
MFVSLVHLMLSLSNSCPYLIKFHDFANKHPTRDETSNGGCNSGPTNPNQNVRTGPVFKLDAMWEPGQFSLDGCHLEWEPSIRFSWWLSYPVITGWFSVKTGTNFGCPTLVSTIGSSFWTILESKNCWFWWNLAKVYLHTVDLENVQMNKKKEKGEFTGC